MIIAVIGMIGIIELFVLVGKLMVAIVVDGTIGTYSLDWFSLSGSEVTDMFAHLARLILTVLLLVGREHW